MGYDGLSVCAGRIDGMSSTHVSGIGGDDEQEEQLISFPLLVLLCQASCIFPLQAQSLELLQLLWTFVLGCCRFPLPNLYLIYIGFTAVSSIHDPGCNAHRPIGGRNTAKANPCSFRY